MLDENVVNDTQVEVVDPQTNTEPESVDTEVAPVQEQEPSTEEVADKGKQSPEVNSKYAEIRRKYEAEKATAVQEASQKAIDAEYERMYGESHGIHTKAEFEAALAEQKKQEEIKQYVDKGVDPELAAKIADAERITAENEKTRQANETKKQTQERMKADNQKFCKVFEDLNGRAFNAKTDTVPKEVWNMVNEGEHSLAEAYAIHELKQYKLGTQTKEQNIEHAETSTGSISGVNTPPDKPLTAADIEKMSPKELSKRWAEVRKVTGMR